MGVTLSKPTFFFIKKQIFGAQPDPPILFLYIQPTEMINIKIIKNLHFAYRVYLYVCVDLRTNSIWFL
jgi:hypothetical protein